MREQLVVEQEEAKGRAAARATFGKVCQHDHLQRQCEVCELTAEVAELREQLAAAQRDLGASWDCSHERAEMRERLRIALTVLQTNAGYMAAHNMLGALWAAVLNDPDNAALLKEPTC